MNDTQFFPAGNTAALICAVNTLRRQGNSICTRPEDADCLLLPVPSFTPDGAIQGGGSLSELLEKLPKNVTVLGGNLDRPELAGYSTIDLLKDPAYLAKNAMITAHCAIRLAMNNLPVILEGCPTLIIGWGRIGKCLARLLKQLGADVTLAARKESDRAVLSALGYRAIGIENLDTLPYRLIFNTAPEMVAPYCPGDGLKIDLASKLGLGSTDVIWARGLPGKDAPESSGNLIAQTIISKLQGKEFTA